MVRNKWREKIEELGYSYRKEVLKIVTANLLMFISCGLITYFLKELLIIALVFLQSLLLIIILFPFIPTRKSNWKRAIARSLFHFCPIFKLLLLITILSISPFKN